MAVRPDVSTSVTAPHAPLGQPLRVVRDPSARPPRLAALRVPLVVKLVGAHALALALMAGAWLRFGATPGVTTVLSVVAVAAVTYVVLLIVALQPVHDLEKLAARVWGGDYAARFRDSSVADAEVLRVGTMFNTLLDGLAADRARMRALAEEVVAVGDRERAALAKELHDSTAQRLAALLLEIAALARHERDPERAARLSTLRDAAEMLTEEVRLLASSVHPRVLDDLGIVAAVRKLARDTARTWNGDVRVSAPDALSLPQPIASVLFRVAHEAIRNAVTHASASQVHISIQHTTEYVALEVTDNGTGFDVAGGLRHNPAMGLFTMRERVSLVDGTFEVRSDNGGTTVVAVIPLPTGAVTGGRK